MIDSNTILLANSTTKTVNVEKIDDKDEYLNIKETVNQEKINKRLTSFLENSNQLNWQELQKINNELFDN